MYILIDSIDCPWREIYVKMQVCDTGGVQSVSKGRDPKEVTGTCVTCEL